MNIDFSQLPAYIWIVAAILALVVAFVVIRFLWKHILKYVVQGCLVIVGILALLELLHFVFKVF